MLIADVAPTAEIQELLAAEHAHRSWVGKVTRPLLDGAAVARLVDAEVMLAAVLSCCCEVETLTNWARHSNERMAGPVHSVVGTDIRDAVGANPACPEWLLWELIDAQRDPAPVLAARVVADAEAGRAAELVRRLTENHRKVPHWVTSALTEAASFDTLSQLLTLHGGWRLQMGLERRDDFWDHPGLFAPWLATAFGDRVVDVLRDSRCTMEFIGTDGLDALAGWLARNAGKQNGVDDVVRWVGDHAGELLRHPGGARLVRAAHAAGAPNDRTRIERIVVGMDLSTVDDDTLAEFLPMPICAGELLRRRGVDDPIAWQFMLTDKDHPGTAGTLAALSAAAVAAAA